MTNKNIYRIIYISFGNKKEIIMNTWFKDALNKFADKHDFFDVIKDFMSEIKCASYEKEITLTYPEADEDHDIYNNGIDLFIQYYSNDMCSNIEVWVREFDNAFNIVRKERLCIYDVMNDAWDSLIATEQFTEKELFDMDYDKYKRLQDAITCDDIADILCDWLE